MHTFGHTAVVVLAISLLPVLSFVSNTALSDTYGTPSAKNAASLNVYKSIDANGRVTYSSSAPGNALHAESIELPPPPDQRDIEAHSARQQTLAQAAQELDDARSQREADRDEREKKRLELMALANQSRQRDIVERRIYVGHPYVPLYPWRHYNHGYDKYPVTLPASRPSHRPLPRSSFRSMF